MSEAALLDRDRRLAWARPGSSHDRNVRIAQVALPSLVGALVAVLAIAPLAKRQEISFVLSKDRVAMATERMRVARAQYRGQDDKGQAFTLDAGSAVQTTSKDPVVQLGNLAARLDTPSGPATIKAPTARYDMDAERLQIDGAMTFASADGYRLSASNVAADLKTRKLTSRSPVSGQMPIGNFSAGNMAADLDARSVVLGGRARLRIVQRAVRGR